MTVIVATGLGYSYGAHCVLESVDMQLDAGSMTLLAGRNGAGKSTLLGLLAGIRRLETGAVELDGRAIQDLHVTERARLVTLVPQDSDTSFEYTGREVVMMGRHPHIPRFGSPGRGDLDAVQQALESTDATEFAERNVQTLSGGELRRVHIARALATKAPVLLADEPTANLDLEHAVAILELLRELANHGHTVLLSSHDLNFIAPRCDQVALLHERRMTHVGTADAVLTDSVIAEVFGVKSSAPQGYFPRDFSPLGE